MSNGVTSPWAAKATETITSVAMRSTTTRGLATRTPTARTSDTVAGSSRAGGRNPSTDTVAVSPSNVAGLRSAGRAGVTFRPAGVGPANAGLHILQRAPG